MNDDYRLQLSGNQINNLLNALLGIGAFWMTADANFNPSTAFGGVWTLVGTKLTIDDHVYGNGKALGLYDSNNNLGMRNQNSGIINTDAFNKNVGTDVTPSAVSNSKALGIHTKAQIIALGTGYEDATGLTTDSVTCYIWQRTA